MVKGILHFSVQYPRGYQQLNFVPINGQLAARGGGVEVEVRKSMAKSTATILFMLIKTTFNKCSLQH